MQLIQIDNWIELLNRFAATATARVIASQSRNWILVKWIRLYLIRDICMYKHITGIRWKWDTIYNASIMCDKGYLFTKAATPAAATGRTFQASEHDAEEKTVSCLNWLAGWGVHCRVCICECVFDGCQGWVICSMEWVSESLRMA